MEALNNFHKRKDEAKVARITINNLNLQLPVGVIERICNAQTPKINVFTDWVQSEISPGAGNTISGPREFLLG